ncbi:non-canonical purine NTP diphosphatase [Paracrocinitomix mangrovi]|uniref:non-canonical purine NTP diphosphatase n=1 Tax=Paracrocinitomix mangrovi TaxID=2862509 RepID=UPI001C8E23D1|nr:non-canonical purine NTP diphosphatase [Paracrocinitomix mangrovi]UKN01244.1 non-canonical purine NTP diphosphatase [Paracrocinitomix mangrovi]
MKLIFATQNQHKADEIQKALPDSIQIMTLKDINCHDDIPETENTLEGNASLKSKYVVEHFNVNCFADDTGLEIEALNGEPGVLSARYAGASKDANDNMNLVLEKLKGSQNRRAQFRTVISLMLEGKEYQFEGIVKGTIREVKSGAEGFGYDPIFQPDGFDITFAEMSMEEKNKISHRGRAVQKLIDFLNKYES